MSDFYDRIADGEFDNNLEAFKVALLDELGLTGHPKAEKVFSRAWERGHSSGDLGEVYSYAVDYADLVL